MSGHVGFVVNKVGTGKVFSGLFSFTANHSTNCSTLIINNYHLGLCKSLQELVYLHNTDYFKEVRTGSVLQNPVKHIPKPKS
jgi:hypothetical protein